MNNKLASVTEKFSKALRDSPDAARDLEPWQNAIQTLGPPAGESFLAHMIATIAAGIKSSSSRGAGARSLFDTKEPNY